MWLQAAFPEHACSNSLPISLILQLQHPGSTSPELPKPSSSCTVSLAPPSTCCHWIPFPAYINLVLSPWSSLVGGVNPLGSTGTGKSQHKLFAPVSLGRLLMLGFEKHWWGCCYNPCMSHAMSLFSSLQMEKKTFWLDSIKRGHFFSGFFFLFFSGGKNYIELCHIKKNTMIKITCYEYSFSAWQMDEVGWAFAEYC